MSPHHYEVRSYKVNPWTRTTDGCRQVIKVPYNDNCPAKFLRIKREGNEIFAYFLQTCEPTGEREFEIYSYPTRYSIPAYFAERATYLDSFKMPYDASAVHYFMS